jgi:hypothetical protein
MKRMFFILAVVLLTQTGTVFPQEHVRDEEIYMLRRMVEQQNETIKALMRRIDALESAQQEQNKWIVEKKEEQKKPVWTDRVKIGGDLRYRYEWIDDERKDDDRNRNRIRARFNVAAEALDTVDLFFQLSTSEAGGDKGEGDPVSGNQTLTDAWSLKNIWLSQAYFDWHPAAIDSLHILGGKIKRPFITPGESELVWDSDVNPEGGVLAYARELDALTLYGNLYGFWIQENSSSSDNGLFGGQAGATYNFTAFDNKAFLTGGVGYYDYPNTKGKPTFYDSEDSFGNSVLADGTYAEDFSEFNLYGEMGCEIKDFPVAVFADYVQNLDVGDEDTGWSVGFLVGKAKKNKWEFRYLYKELKKDAVLGLFTDSDFAGGGTNVKGHEIDFAYQLAKNWTVATSYFNNKTGISDDEEEEDYQRLQLDVLFNF